MNYSKDGLSLTESFEGCRLTSYQDQVGVWTIGYGHTKGVGPGMTCDQAQAEQWLLDDVADAETAVNKLVHIAMSQEEFDALVDFTFNLGIGNFSKSTLLAKLNARDIQGAADEFEKWDRAGGVEVAGLLRRRQAEKALFSLGADFTGGAA
ncbi:muraminidase [Burkholderia lata]|uniref:Lysozyme n=1 Tax=Burkholderia lata (strain ATCC 17760 / DSM 23089 / LMG 22485 / NCIMB 9086 / R18194 / 383) TaxID=482957 RepID=A0A6P2WLD1_BURL3|nr:lysozyme [Burkholderia lata]VWC96143.1 muraminidase [Burkholderia lata]